MSDLYTTENSEVCHESIEDAICGISHFPVEILVMRRKELDVNWFARRVIDVLIEELDEDLGHPDGDPTPITPAMRQAAQAFVEAVCKDYIPWQCEETGKRFWVDENGEEVKGKI